MGLADTSAPDGYGKASTECDDAIEYFVYVRNEVIAELRFQVEGCANTLVCAQAGWALAQGKPLAEARHEATAKAIFELAGLDEPRRHCAELAASALSSALRDAVLGQREPWRKLYRHF